MGGVLHSVYICSIAMSFPSFILRRAGILCISCAEMYDQRRVVRSLSIQSP